MVARILKLRKFFLLKEPPSPGPQFFQSPCNLIPVEPAVHGLTTLQGTRLCTEKPHSAGSLPRENFNSPWHPQDLSCPSSSSRSKCLRCKAGTPLMVCVWV